jgi:hypothetical protein
MAVNGQQENTQNKEGGRTNETNNSSNDEIRGEKTTQTRITTNRQIKETTKIQETTTRTTTMEVSTKQE